MADVNVSIALAGITEIEKSLGSLKAQFDGLGVTGKTASASFDEVGKSIATTGAKVSLMAAPLALFSKNLIQTAADYESAMKTLQVSSGATADQMARVAEMSKQFGADTTFSTSQAVEGFQALATGGVNLNDAFNGVMQATVDFAAATKTQLGPAAEFAGDVMQSFNKTAQEMPNALNAVYNATLQSKFGVDDFSYALSKAGPSAMQLNVPFNELNALLATTSSGFNSGMETGTSMGIFLQSLSPTSKAAAAAMKELGLITADGANQFFTSEGKLKSLTEVQNIATKAFSSLTDQQRLQYSATIFSQQGMDTLNQILIRGVGAYETNLAAVNKLGTAHKASQEQMEGFNGAIDKFGGAVDLLGVRLQEAGVIDWLTSIVEWMADTVEWISKADPLWVKVAASVAAFAIAAGPVLVVLGGMAIALGALLTPIGAVVAAIVGIAAVLTASVAAWEAWGDDIKAYLDEIIDAAVTWAKSLYQELVGGMNKALEGLTQSVSGAVDKVKNFFSGMVDGINRAVAPVTDTIVAPFAAAPAAIAPISKEILNPFAKWPADIGKAVAPVEKAIVDPFQKAADAVYLHSIVPDMVDGVIDLFSEMEDEVGKISEIMADNVENEINAILDDTTMTMEEQAKALEKLGPKYQSMGQYGVQAMNRLQPEVEDLNKAVAKNEDVLGGVKTALAANVNAWGGWGASAGRIVDGFSQTAEASLSEFFMTGELDLENFGLALKQTLADEASKTIVSFASNGIKQFLGLGQAMQGSMQAGAAGIDQAGASAAGASASMGWLAIAVIAIVAALAIFKLAGGEFGDLLEKIGDMAKALGGFLIDVLLVPVNLLIAGFTALVDLLGVFVKWIGTVGDALGKGDLKDLFKIFEGFNPLKGIGDLFSGIFDIFHEGGLIPGKGDIAIRAEGGEFVMSKAATDMFGPMLAAMNAHGLGKSVNIAAATAGDAARADPFKAFASGGDMMLTRPTLLLGGESGPEMVSFRHAGRGGNDAPIVNNGILVADRLTLNQLGKKLYRNAQRDQLRTRKR